jgi:hypothetical protein
LADNDFLQGEEGAMTGVGRVVGDGVGTTTRGIGEGETGVSVKVLVGVDVTVGKGVEVNVGVPLVVGEDVMVGVGGGVTVAEKVGVEVQVSVG